MRMPSKLDPEMVRALLDSALTGDLQRQAELFALMEDTWYRLAKNLNDVRNGVADSPWRVAAFAIEGEEPTPEAEEKARLVENVFKQMEPSPASIDEAGFRGMLFNLLDAHARGISVQEIEWGTADGTKPFTLKDGTWGIRAVRHINARNYGYPCTGDIIDRLMLSPDGTGASGNLIDFPPDKFIIAKALVRSGHPANIALLRSIALLWVGHTFGFLWMANYAQLFGVPFRWATYEPGNDQIKKNVSEMLQNMGSAGWAAFPTGTSLQFVSASGTAKDNPQAYLMEMADKACDILILGQTLTTDVGDSGSRALGDVHAGIRLEVIKHAAKWLEEVINDQLIPAIMRMNYGEIPDDCPSFHFAIEEPKDGLAMANRDKILFDDMGLPVSKDWLYKRHGVPQPKPDDELFKAPAPKPSPFPFQPTPGEQDPKEGKPDAVNTAVPAPAKAREGFSVQAKAKNELRYQIMASEIMTDIAGVSAEWLAAAKPIFVELVRKAESGEVSDADFMAAVQAAAEAMPEMFGKLDADSLALALEKEMGAACVNGALEGARKRS